MDKIANRSLSASLLSGIVLLFASMPITAIAFEELNEPQTLIYDTDHLAKTEVGSTIRYTYEQLRIDQDPVKDEVLLSITKLRDENRRDVSVKFLSDDIKLHLPDFDNYRGNPVIIGMLEHLAQSLGYDSGGGALYFRNRIRDELASKEVKVKNHEVDGVNVEDVKINVTEFSFTPLKNDPYVANTPELTESTITLAFSDDLPGYLVSIAYVSGPGNKPDTTRTLTFSGVQ